MSLLSPESSPENTTPPPVSTKHRHRVLRAFAWIVASLFVLLLLVVGGLAIYSGTQNFQNRVRSELISTLEESTGGKVDLAAVHFSLWHLAIEADGLVIHGLEGPGQAPYVAADRILVHITLKNLFAHATNSKGAMKYITLALLQVDKPEVHLIINKDGTTNQPVPKKPSTSNEPVMDTLLDLQASKVVLANGTVLLNDRAIPFDLDADDLGVNVHYITATDRYGLSLDIADLRTRMQQMPVAQSKLHLQGELGRQLIALQTLTFDTGKNSHLDASARVQNFNDPTWSVQVKGNLEVPQISVLSGFPGLDAGTVDLDIAGHSCTVTPQEAQKQPHFWQRRHPNANPTSTKVLPPSPDCPKGYLVAGGAKLHNVGYRDEYVNVYGVNGGANVRVTPTQLLFQAIALNLPGGGSVAGDMRIDNWLGEIPSQAPTESATIVAGQKTVNATAKIANAKPPATGSVAINPTQRAHAYVDVKLANISLRTINEVTEPRRYTDLGFDTAVNGPVHVEWGGNTDALPKSVVVQTDLTLAPQGLRRKGATEDIPVNGVVKATYRGADETVTIQQLEAHTPASNVNITGSLAIENYVTNLNVTADLRDLSEFDSVLSAAGVSANGKQGSAALPVVLHGDAHFQGTVRGPVSDIDVKGHLQANQLVAHLGSEGDVAIDSVVADAEYSAAGVTVASSTIKRGTAVLQVAGAIQPHRVVRRRAVTYEFDDLTKVNLNAHLNDAQMHDVLDIAGQGKLPITGVLSVNAQVTGTLGNLDGTGTVVLRNGVAYGEPFDAVNANVAVQGQQVTATALQVRAQGVQVDGNGSYNLKTAHVQAHLQGSGIRLSNLKVVQQANSPVDGVLTFQADANGTVQQPGLRAHLQLANATYQGQAIGQLTADVHSDKDVVYLTANSTLVGTAIQVTGQMQLAGDYPMQAHATFTNLNAANVLKLTGSTVDVTSQANGDLTLSGPAKKPYALQGALTVSPLSITGAGLEFHSAAPLHVTLANGTAHLEELHIVGPETDLTASGSVQLFGANGAALPPAGGHIDARANGSVNVAIAHRFNPQIIASGEVKLAITAGGTTGNPVLGGKVSFVDTNLAYSEIPNGLSNMNGSASFTENRLVVDDITAYSGGGRIKLNGFVQFRNGLFADLTATATSVRVRYYGVSLIANATARLQGDADGATLSGNVLITRFGLAKTFDFGSIAGGATDVAPPPNPDSLLNKIALDVRVQSSPALDFQNSYARLAGTVDLSLRGTLETPSVLGKIILTDGTATFNDTKYQLERGQIYFNNPIRINPLIDIDATARVENYDVIIGLHGTASNPKLSYRSEPPLSQADVFNLLALGRTAEEASISSQQLQQEGQDPTTNALLSGALNATVSSRVNKLFGGAGKVKIDPAYVGSIGTSSARITVEQQLTPKITVTFATSVNASQQQLIQAQYAISDNVTVVAQRDENGVFSIVYKIRRRYH